MVVEGRSGACALVGGVVGVGGGGSGSAESV